MNVDPPTWWQWLWSIGIAGLGGMAAFLRKLQLDELKRVWYLEACIDVFIGSFAGLIIMMIAHALELSTAIAMPLTGIAGIMGYKALNKATFYFDKWLGVPKDGGQP